MCRHCVITGITLVVTVVVNVSCLVCLVTAFALVPMLVCIGYPSRAVAMSMRRRRYAHSVCTSIASTVVVAVHVCPKLTLFLAFALFPVVICIGYPIRSEAMVVRRRCYAHSVRTSIASTVVVAVYVCAKLALFLAFALFPVVICIGYPIRSKAMVVWRRRYTHSVSASVARAVVIAVVVSSLIKLLIVTACAFVPVMSIILLPLCFCTVICQFAIGLTTNRTYCLGRAGCRTAGVLMIDSHAAFITVSVYRIAIIATFICYLSASVVAQVVVIGTVCVLTNVGHAAVAVANVIGVLVQMSESRARGFGTVTAS